MPNWAAAPLSRGATRRATPVSLRGPQLKSRNARRLRLLQGSFCEIICDGDGACKGSGTEFVAQSETVLIRCKGKDACADSKITAKVDKSAWKLLCDKDKTSDKVCDKMAKGGVGACGDGEKICPGCPEKSCCTYVVGMPHPKARLHRLLGEFLALRDAILPACLSAAVFFVCLASTRIGHKVPHGFGALPHVRR